MIMPTKILFLDLDGVLNSINYIKSLDGDFDDPINQIDPVAVIRLNNLILRTGASVVISSTWRLIFRRASDPLKTCQNSMACYKIVAPIIGMTGVESGGRKEEIKMWLSEHPEVEKFVIIDDDVIGAFEGHIVKTSVIDGLQDEHVEQAIKILSIKEHF